MLLWALIFSLSFTGLRLILGGPSGIQSVFRFGSADQGLARAIGIFHELQETLQAGVVPTTERWQELRALPRPWGSLASESIEGLRANGSAVLPTLVRLRGLAEEHRDSLKSARAKSAQASAQAMVCLALVPLFGFTLYWILPGVESRTYSWLVACAVAALLSTIGAFWLFRMAEEARWGGLRASERAWILGAQCAGERFLALVRAGVTADLAWSQACELLTLEAPELAALWGHNVWHEPKLQATNGSGARIALAAAGSSLRKALQVSLMEGRPCTERVEAALTGLRADLKSQVERELTLLGARALRPLFLCVAPALFGLLIFGMWLAWLDGSAGFV